MSVIRRDLPLVQGNASLRYECILVHEATKAKLALPAVPAKSMDDLKAANAEILVKLGLGEIINTGLRDGSWSVGYSRIY